MTLPNGPDLDLQKAIYDRLMASVDLKTLAGNPVRLIYEGDPVPATFPYITIGESQEIEDYQAEEVYHTLHIWSKASGVTEVKQIVAVIKAELDGQTMALAQNVCKGLYFDGVKFGGTEAPPLKHRIITFRAVVESA